ncbi:MAG: sigma 54-interacting transcriptional regulator [Bdellovibrionales bacterium]|nr:sigma 54-interacting transcriptional regulator [Bdellovibrionales bacterium]
MLINWDEFEHIHVIKKLKQILATWWNIDVVFTDEAGTLRGFGNAEGDQVNKAVFHFLKSGDARESLSQLVNQSLVDLRQSQNRYAVKKWDATGFDVAVFPIEIEREFMGTVVAMGFVKDASETHRRSELAERFAAGGINPEAIAGIIESLRFLTPNEKNHFMDLVELISREIITLHVEITSREERIKELNKELGSRYKYDKIIGKSKPMQSLYSLMDKIKSTDSTVLIQGENGTGKDLIANSIHYNSVRKDRPFVVSNCSAFNDNLLESELFGHTKGSFTGAHKDKKGLFELADKGTFFLDEIGDTSPQMQVKLLRVLQEGTFTPVGALEMKRVDVRIIAATNRDLRKMVEEGTFREDLYYRLNVINIRVPPLRERKEDIPLLTEAFIESACKKAGLPKRILTKRALEKLYDYPFPGNVRELQNEMERAVVLSGTESKILADMLSPKILESNEATKIQGTRVAGTLKDAIEDLEKDLIREGLRRTGWNKSKLAKELGISRAGLIMKVEKYGLDKRRVLGGVNPTGGSKTS